MADESKKTVFRRAVAPAQEQSQSKKKYLVGYTPPYLGKPFELNKDQITIGREEGRDIVIASEMVSRLHATLTAKGDDWTIQDNGSSNGTLLNNQMMEANRDYPMSHKDVLKFDTFEFIFIDSSREDLWETLKPLNREGSQILSVYSPKGGVGLTSTAVNLAHALSKNGKKVVIADFNFAFGDVLTFSSGKPGLSICDLMREPQITAELVEKYLQKTPSYSFLAAPNKTEEAELVNEWGTKHPDKVQKILWSLTTNYDFVIVDLKNQIDDVMLTVWELSSTILLFGRPEIGHLLALKKILTVMDQLKYPESKVKILVTRMEREGALNAQEIQSFLKRDFLPLPDAPKEAIVTTQGGKLYVAQNPGEPLAKGIENLARSIRGEETGVVAEGGVFGKLKALLGF